MKKGKQGGGKKGEDALYYASFQVGAQVNTFVIVRNPYLQLMLQNPNQSQLSYVMG